MTPPLQQLRPSQSISAPVRVIVSIMVGGVLMFVGLGGAMYQIEHPPLVKPALYAFLGLGVLGALLLPAIFPLVQQIVVFVVPYIPFIGGRRAGDPPASKP